MNTQTTSLSTISDLKLTIKSGLPLFRHQLTPPALCFSPRPLIPGTAEFADKWLDDWSNGHRANIARDVALYNAMDAVVSGNGQVWLDGQLVISDEIMPDFVARLLNVDAGGNAELHSSAKLPLRIVESPCLIATGHGIQVYGHFLIDLMFRLLVTDYALSNTNWVPYRVLLDFAAPKWLLKILEEDFGIGPDRVEFFFPQHERVMLRNAWIPTNICQIDGFNPLANMLIDRLFDRLNLAEDSSQAHRIFVSRTNFHNPASRHRVCTNEQNLIDIAAKRYGFICVKPELMSWRDQITLFRHAKIIVGHAGSGLHNALFSEPDCRVASIANMNFVQLHIGALRGLNNAFLTKSVELQNEFSVDETLFEAFLGEVTAVI